MNVTLTSIEPTYLHISHTLVLSPFYVDSFECANHVLFCVLLFCCCRCCSHFLSSLPLIVLISYSPPQHTHKSLTQTNPMQMTIQIEPLPSPLTPFPPFPPPPPSAFAQMQNLQTMSQNESGFFNLNKIPGYRKVIFSFDFISINIMLIVCALALFLNLWLNNSEISNRWECCDVMRTVPPPSDSIFISHIHHSILMSNLFIVIFLNQTPSSCLG